MSANSKGRIQIPWVIEITKAFNDQVKILAKEMTSVKVWVYKGLFKRDSHYLDRRGVNLNFRGTLKYYHSIQVAVRYYIDCLT